MALSMTGCHAVLRHKACASLMALPGTCKPTRPVPDGVMMHHTHPQQALAVDRGGNSTVTPPLHVATIVCHQVPCARAQKTGQGRTICLLDVRMHFTHDLPLVRDGLCTVLGVLPLATVAMTLHPSRMWPCWTCDALGHCQVSVNIHGPVLAASLASYNTNDPRCAGWAMAQCHCWVRTSHMWKVTCHCTCWRSLTDVQRLGVWPS